MPEPLLVTPVSTPLPETPADAVLLPLFQDEDPSGNTATADEALGGVVRELRERKEVRADAYEVTLFPTLGRLPTGRIALVGLGKRADYSPTTLRLAMAAAGRALGKRGLYAAATDAADWPGEAAAVSEALAEGAELSRFVVDTYRSGERRDVQLRELRVANGDAEALRRGRARGRAKNLARNLVNEPANVLGPEELAAAAEAMAAEVGLSYRVIEEAEMEELGMGAILAVTRGSERPAKLIVLSHFPAGTRREDRPLLALVGKAVTFDTGGISIKPAADMGRMKGDMAGGAAVVGAMRAIAELGIDADVLGLVPAAENMPDGRAWRPGDVITAMSGKTIETLSTDAEGRMLLADAIHYARTQGATHIVDIATLTGACVVALGTVASGLFATDPELGGWVREAGEAAGERHWPMPLLPEYRELIRSEIADLKNSGGRYAGAVTAAMFLKEFAGDTPWVHLDIAGSSHLDKAKPWAPAGPTGTGVGTFVNLAVMMGETVES